MLAPCTLLPLPGVASPSFPLSIPAFLQSPYSFPRESSSFMDEMEALGPNGSAARVLGRSGSFALEYRGYREFRPRPIPGEDFLWDSQVCHEAGSPHVDHEV